MALLFLPLLHAKRLTTQNHNLTMELDNLMIEKQSKEEVERVMDGAGGGSGEDGAASVAAVQALQTENNRLTATVQELSGACCCCCCCCFNKKKKMNFIFVVSRFQNSVLSVMCIDILHVNYS